MSDRKEQLEHAELSRVEVEPDGSYGIGWKSATRPAGDVLVPDTTPRSELTMRIELGESRKDGVQHKRLWVHVSCDGAIGEHHEDQPVTAFRDNEHAIKWAQRMVEYLNRHLSDRLRTMTLLTVREAIAKSSDFHGIEETDWKKLAEAHAAIMEQRIKESLGVHSGPTRLFRTKQHYLNFLAEAARACRAAGNRFTQEWVADFATSKFDTEKPIDERMIRKWNRHYRANWNWYADKVNRTN